MEEIYDFLKKVSTYYLATGEGNHPRVRPLGTVDIFEGKLYIQTGKIKDVFKQQKKNPKIEICAFDGAGSWIRVKAIAKEDNRVEAKQHMLDAYPNLKDRYIEDKDNTEVLFLKDAIATISSFSEEPRTVKF